MVENEAGQGHKPSPEVGKAEQGISTCDRKQNHWKFLSRVVTGIELVFLNDRSCIIISIYVK